MEAHTPENQQMKCSFSSCGKILSSKYNLKRHIESCHNGIRPYECSICFKKFSSKQNKREHVRLEHSYSIFLPASEEHKQRLNIISIPKLSQMVYDSSDAEIRPLTRIARIYLYSDLCEKIDLPTLEQPRTNDCKLPAFF